jgi:hypothetical protein
MYLISGSVVTVHKTLPQTVTINTENIKRFFTGLLSRKINICGHDINLER